MATPSYKDSPAAGEPQPLSVAQADVWRAQKLLGQRSLYNIGGYVQILGSVDRGVLRDAAEQALREGESAFLTFVERADAPRQIMAAPPIVELPLVDLRATADPDVAAQAWMRAALDTPFDLSLGPLFRLALLQVSADRVFLFSVFHHLVCDLYGATALLRRTASLYNAAIGVAEADASPLTPWSEVLADEAVYRGSDQCDRDRAYWRQLLADRPEPATLSGQPPAWPGKTINTVGRIEGPLLQKLHSLGGGGATGLATVLCSAIALYLARVSGNRDVVLAMPVAARTSSRLRHASGFLSNVVPLRLDVDLTRSFVDLATHAASRMRDALRHQRYWNSALRSDLGVSAAEPGIFGVTVNFMPSDAKVNFAGQAAQLNAFTHSPRVEDLSVTVHAVRDGSDVRVQFDGNASRYSEPQLHRHRDNLLTLLKALAEGPQLPMRELSAVTATERRRLLEDWSGRGSIGSGEMLLRRLASHAERAPEAPALICGGRCLTYRQLVEQSDSLAGRLRARGVGAESIVGLWADRSVEMIVGVLGVWKAGAAYLPLDPSSPAERLRLILKDAQPAVVLGSPGSPRADLIGGIAQLRVQTGDEPAARGDEAPGPHPDDAAYVIYTSGSSGTPKAVAVTHAGLGSLAAAQTRQLRVTAQSRVLQYASLSFDASVWELLMALWNGASLVVAPAEALSGRALQTLLERERITHVLLPPAVLATLSPEKGSSPECLVVGGEACAPKLVEQWGSDRRMINAYGPSEVTVCATLSAPLTGNRVSIGTPIEGTCAYVLDAALEPVPVGVIGELYIGGAGLARGYLKRPSLTAERFVANPFGPPGTRMYRSGDLVRWNEEGALEYVGRADQQVKVRGQRIELGEIEAMLSAQPQIEQAAVVVRESTDIGKSLVAYIVGREGRAIDIAALRSALAARLPQYMIPSQFVALPRLPLNSSGKVNRRALPVPEMRAVDPAEAPIGAVETALASLWSELLRVAHVGRNDNFFEMGGNSLLIAELGDRLVRRGWRVEVQQLFAQPTIAGLAKAIETGAGASRPGESPATGGIPAGCAQILPEMLPLATLDEAQIESVVARVPGGAANVQNIYPLAPLQEGLLIQHRASARDPYILRTLLVFADRERVEAFVKGLQRVIDRHDVLRTAVQWEGLPEPMQVVWRSALLPVDWGRPGQSMGVDDLWGQGSASIEVTHAPMIRVRVAHDAGYGRWLLLLQSHHMILDHESLSQVLAEVGAFMRDRGESLPAARPFHDFVAAARVGAASTLHNGFFRRMFAGVREPTAAFGIRDIRADGTGVEETRQPLEGSLARRVREQARRFGVAPSTAFHLAWAVVLAQASARRDVIFGTVLSGRMKGGLDAPGTVGLCINTLPLRISLEGKSAVAALLDTHVQLGELLSHEHASLASARQFSEMPGGVALFSALINYRHDPMRISASAPVELLPGVTMLRTEERSNYRLNLCVDDLGDGFTLTVQVDAEVGSLRVCRMVSDALESLTSALEKASSARVQSMQLLSSEAADPEPERWSRTASAHTDVPRGEPIGPSKQIQAAFEEPRTDTEKKLAAIWCEVLRVETIGRFDDFFALGGHSLLALQVVARVRDVFRLELPLKAPFDATTLASLAATLDESIATGSSRRPTGIEPVALTGPAPLSWSQERMWLIQSINPLTTAYNMAMALWFNGSLDVDAFSQSFDEVVRRHEVLRSRIHITDGQPRQIVMPWSPGNLQVSDLREHPDAEGEALGRARSDAQTVFDLEKASPLRARLARTSDNRFFFSLVLHHVAGDQWSVGVFGRELARLYNGRRHVSPKEAAARLPALPLSYRDFAAWQRNPSFTKQFGQQLEFWRKQLADVPTVDLPTDHPRPKLWTMNGAFLRRPMPPELLPALDRLARSAGGTKFMTLFAGFAVLLSRLSGQQDIAIGVPVASRTHSEIEALVGTFVNTLVLRTDLRGDPDFREMLSRVRSITLDAFANQDIPFDRLVQELGHGHDRSRMPLTQVLFNVVNAPMHGIDLEGVTWGEQVVDRGGSQFELSVTVDTERTHSLAVEYNVDLFEASTIERLVDQYFTLLQAAAATPQVRVGRLPLLPPAQLITLRDFNASRRAMPVDAFPRLFEAQVARTPASVAITFEGGSVTYAQLNARANRFARALAAAGAQRECVVAVCVPRSPALVVALLAVQKSGAAYVPLDPDFPAERLTFMLADSGARVLATVGPLPQGVQLPDGVEVLDVQVMAGEAGEGEASLDLTEGPELRDAAYLLYTSGSTGWPKGVLVPHGALVNFLCSMREQPGLSGSDVLAAVTTVSFDIAGLELYLPLLVGARIELLSKQVASDGAALAQVLDGGGITIMQATPATWRMLIDAGWRGTERFRALCGGEALSRKLGDEILQRAGELWNLYGPTETTIWSTIERVERGAAAISIGKPIANTQVHVLDRAGAPTPIGVSGEICIGGEGVAVGYHARPELTAERFMADAFADTAGRRLYRTGDQGRWGVDGKLYHLGRLDHQVKIRGFRIELGEVEQVLSAHPAVQHAVAAVREARPEDLRLVAYVTFAEGELPTVGDIKRFLRGRLPDYSIPSIVMSLPQMPLTPNGKVDRAALPDPFVSSYRDTAVREPPATAMERELAQIWKTVLGVAQVDALDNFFELGGYSLLSLQVARLVEKRSGRQLDPRALFFHNLRDIARMLDGVSAAS